MSILKNIPELVEAGIISGETADKIKDYYRNKGEGFSKNRLFVVFGILGAILTGLGIILIIAHNWDNFSRSARTLFAFLPLIIGQILCGFVLIKKHDSIAWKESATTFLFFAVGACISLVSQIYNIPGNLSGFLFIWMILCLPLVYLMKSSVASLFYLIGITYYAAETCYFSPSPSESYFYWVLLLLVFPHYFNLYEEKPESNFMIFHNWLVPLSVVITLGTVSKNTKELMFIAYISLFGLYYLIGNMAFFKQQKLKNNGYLVIGSIGTIVLLLFLSFGTFWDSLRNRNFQFNDLIYSPEFIATGIITLLAAWLLYLQKRNKPFTDINPIESVFVFFIIIFIIGLSSPVSIYLINLVILIIGVLTIVIGAKHDHLGILNYGLLIIMALVACKFFDEDLSFVIRGILFIAVGIGFFIANYLVLKKRKNE